MELFLYQVCMCLLLPCCLVQCKGDDSPELDVIVVGGGLAGMAAARRLTREKRQKFNVHVFEGRKDRYGGRIWTDRKSFPKAVGAEVELGPSFINTKATEILELVEKYELRTTELGPVKIFLPDEGKEFEGDAANKLYAELVKVISSAIERGNQSMVDIPFKEAVLKEIQNFNTNTSKGILEDIMETLLLSGADRVSLKLFNTDYEFGFSKLLLDGFDTLIDRIVHGDEMEMPLKVKLGKEVRQLKIDEKKNKVLVRTRDGKQEMADIAIVALPIGVLKSTDIHFDPPLSKQWYKAVQDVGCGHSDKVIVGFEDVFWPKDDGAFFVVGGDARNGFFQSWINLYPLTGKPFLMGNVFGNEQAIKDIEKYPDQYMQKRVLKVLSSMFGEKTMQKQKVTHLIRSKWTYEKQTRGSFSYPRVGNKMSLWETLSKPVCPYIYFAGAHTEFQGHADSVGGAYLSGIRAAEQIINGYCKSKEGKKTGKTKGKKLKEKSKDEL